MKVKTKRLFLFQNSSSHLPAAPFLLLLLLLPQPIELAHSFDGVSQCMDGLLVALLHARHLSLQKDNANKICGPLLLPSSLLREKHRHSDILAQL